MCECDGLAVFSFREKTKRYHIISIHRQHCHLVLALCSFRCTDARTHTHYVRLSCCRIEFHVHIVVMENVVPFEAFQPNQRMSVRLHFTVLTNNLKEAEKNGAKKIRNKSTNTEPWHSEKLSLKKKKVCHMSQYSYSYIPKHMREYTCIHLHLHWAF